VLERLKNKAKNLLSATFFVFILFIVSFFQLSSCTATYKNVASFFGLGNSTETSAPTLEDTFRPPIFTDKNDLRILRHLYSIAHKTNLGIEFQTSNHVIIFVKAPEINAFSFSQEIENTKVHIFGFFEGLHRAPDEVVRAIVAHEIAHVVHEHSTKMLEKSYWVDKLTRFTGTVVGTLITGDSDNATLEQASSWTNMAILPRYSQEFELEADTTAVQLLKEIGISQPEKSMQSALKWIKENSSSEELGGGFFSSHPALADRIKNVSDD
jgi:Zn-dependent protease with chaperone function